MITIDWGTKIINVPKVDTVLIQSSPTEVRELNINTFRLILKDLEDDEEGINFVKTHNHNPPVSVSGIELARVVEILDPYTITFEDDNYAVNLVGANSNIADKVNLNQVSIRSANSAGLIQTREIEHSSFQDVVIIDVDNGVIGTLYPIGTRTNPVNNLEDAKLIASTRGFDVLLLASNLTVPTGGNLDGLTIRSENWFVLTLEGTVSTIDTHFEKIALYGALSGQWNILVNCWAYNITNFTGWMISGSFVNISLAPYDLDPENNVAIGQSFFDDVVPMEPGDIGNITMNDNAEIVLTNTNCDIAIFGMETGSKAIIGFGTGNLYLDSSSTGGSFTVGGIGTIIGTTGGATVDSTNLINATIESSNITNIKNAVWDEDKSTHTTSESYGKILADLEDAVKIIKTISYTQL